MRWLSEPEPILAAAVWIDSIGRTSLRASSTLVAIASSRNANSRNAVRQIADLSGANASLSGCSTKTRQPSGLIAWNALSTLRPSSSRPTVTSARSRVERCSNLWKRCKARMPEDEIDVGVGDEFAARVDCVRIAGRSDPRPVDHLPDGAEVDVGDDRAASRRPLGDGRPSGAASHSRSRPDRNTGASTARRGTSGSRRDRRRCRSGRFPARRFEPAPSRSCPRSSPGRWSCRGRGADGSPGFAASVQQVPSPRSAARQRRAPAASSARAARSRSPRRKPCRVRTASTRVCCPDTRSRAP